VSPPNPLQVGEPSAPIFIFYPTRFPNLNRTCRAHDSVITYLSGSTGGAELSFRRHFPRLHHHDTLCCIGRLSCPPHVYPSWDPFILSLYFFSPTSELLFFIPIYPLRVFRFLSNTFLVSPTSLVVLLVFPCFPFSCSPLLLAHLSYGSPSYAYFHVPTSVSPRLPVSLFPSSFSLFRLSSVSPWCFMSA